MEEQGQFTSTAGLVVDLNSGTIDVSASTVGNYVVTYTPTSTCVTADTFAVEILAAADATFSYPATTNYCALTDTNPLPASVTQAGGTFSSATGVVFVDATTGEVDLSTTPTGVSHTITYTVNSGVCVATSTLTNVFTVDASEEPELNYNGTYCIASGVNPVANMTGSAGGTYSATPAGITFVSTATGEINIAASAAGTYDITFTPAASCSEAVTQEVRLATTAVAAFSYTPTSYCPSDANPVADMTGTTVGGVFSNATGVVFADASTGEIDLANSASGDHTITYTVSVPGCTPETFDFDVTLNALDNASFTYGASSFCVDGIDAVSTPALAGGAYSSTAGLSLDTTTGAIDVSGSTPGSYVVTYTTAGACPSTSTVTVSIDASVDATFSYDAASYCQDGLDATPSTTGGAFTSSPAGLALNATTGVIDVSSSEAGTYTVTYTLTNGSCEDSSDQTVVIEAKGDADFYYSQEKYCKDLTDANPVAIVNGTPGGVFTSATVVFADATTGEIDLLRTDNGVHEITYTTPGTCSDSQVFTLEVQEGCERPEAFTPNGDGLNDNYDLRGENVAKLEIYSRYGKLVYSKDDYTNEWTGLDNNGTTLSNGTYFVVIQRKDGSTTTSYVYLTR